MTWYDIIVFVAFEMNSGPLTWWVIVQTTILWLQQCLQYALPLELLPIPFGNGNFLHVTLNFHLPDGMHFLLGTGISLSFFLGLAITTIVTHTTRIF